MKPALKRPHRAFLSFLFATLIADFSTAASVTVGDPSFEGNALAEGGWAYDLSPEWTGTDGNISGNAFEEYVSGFAADGTDHLGVENGYDVWQDLAVTYQQNTRYTLTIAAGNRAGNSSAGNQTEYLLADNTGTIYSTGAIDASTSVSTDSFADAPALVFDTPSNPAALGKTIRILLRARGNGRSHFDHIRLDASPLSAGLAGVSNQAATSITATGATLNGTVTSMGAAAPTVTLFWGNTDGGFIAGNWQNSVTLSGTQSGSFSNAISGLSPNSSYFFTCRATNSAGDSWAPTSLEFETPALPPAVSNIAASGIAATTATVGANVTSTGGENPTVRIYYGTTDGGTSTAAWSDSVDLGTGSGVMSALLSGLQPATSYRFRALASNSGGQAWAASSATFTTSSAVLPVVEVRNADGITGTTATFKGEVTDIGTAAPAVTLYYGTSDGGSNAASWTNNIPLGTQSGEFSKFVTGLSPNTTYRFRYKASNNSGTTWSATAGTLTTTGLVPSTAVINEFHYNPLDNTSLEEFIELHNPGDAAIDLTGWTLSDAVTYTFPAGTTLPAGGYLVVAENPSVLQTKYSITGVRGPWTGNLSSAGEKIVLKNAAGVTQDSVDYGAGFPWPTGADGAGPSAELIYPSLDNDLGGSWRSSYNPGTSLTTYIPAAASGWKYKKGTAEASSPTSAWRAIGYNDSSWLTGQTSIGYDDGDDNTIISDMRYNYWSIYFRKTFTVPSNQIPDTLTLKLWVDDGCVVWINGREVARAHIVAASGDPAYNTAAQNHDATGWETYTLTNTSSYLVGGTNVIAIHAANSSLSSSDFSMDAQLISGGTGASSNPTPGRANGSLLATQLIPPQIRQVSHTPANPTPGVPVVVTAKITDPDGMGAVSLLYQTVSPGSYIRKTDASYSTGWTSATMVDNGTNGDAVAGDSIYSATIPASVQTHRRLVRYKITMADALGNSLTAPYSDDEQPNFAYFVYSGTPSWSGAFNPGTTAVQTYSSALQDQFPPFHIIANTSDISSFQSGDSTRYYATVVNRGKVFDHVQFRVRGIGSTTVSGKNKWNIYFNRARDYQAYDNYGIPYKETWNNLLINANSSPWAAVNRGSAGIEEAASNRIFQLAGLPAQHTHYLHLRVIDEAAESGATQYDGDLWGLYLGMEPTEGNFLDERGLADGNVYSIEGGGGDKKHQGPTQSVDSSDWSSFSSAVSQSGQTEQWYRDNVDLDALYTFLALNRLIGNVDVRPGDNYRFYHRPTDNRWVIIPYDLDMQFIAAHHWGGTMDNNIVVAGAPNVIRAISRWPNLAREFRNRCRELLSLMASDGTTTGGQVGQLFNEFAQMVNPTGVALTWADLDAAMWNMNPKTTGSVGTNSGQSNHKGNFFRATYYDGTRGAGGTTSTTSWIRSIPDPDANGFGDHEGLTQWFVNYATNTWPGGTWYRKAMTGIGSGTDTDVNRQKGYGYKYLEFESLYGGWVDCNSNPTTAANTDYPNKPTLTYSGKVGYPVNDLRFTSSAFSDPQGAGTFSAWQWRIAEIYTTGVAGYVSGTPYKYEIETLASSGDLTTSPGVFKIPLGVTTPGKTYRVRVRHKDSAGNWSYWSEPAKFTATPQQLALLHYWNFNDTANLLVPTQTMGGAAMAVAGAFLSDTGQSFEAANVKLDDPADSHLRVNNPLTAGTQVTAAIPTTGFQNIVVKYETRRSGQGAGTQNISYTLNGTSYTSFATFTIVDGTPEIKTLDFSSVSGANNNPLFGIRITFTQGTGGTSGNNRFDNLTVEADPVSQPRLLPDKNATWNYLYNWANATIPNATAASAIIGAPAADRDVTLASPATIGSLSIDTAATAFRNRVVGTSALTFAATAPDNALLEVTGSSSGVAELDLTAPVTLASSLRLNVLNSVGDPDDGALRLRSQWTGGGGLIKQGGGTASLTGAGKDFTGAVVIEQGVLQVTQPAVPALASGVAVQPGAQLRLVSGNDANGARVHTFGGSITLAGTLGYDPAEPGNNQAIVTNAVAIPSAAVLHVEGSNNTLALGGAITGAGVINKTGLGALVLTGNSPARSAAITVSEGPLEVNGNLSAAPIQIAVGTTLRGSGGTGPISGAGIVAPHLTRLTAVSSSAADYDFICANTGSNGNSLLRLTAASPLPMAPATIDLFVNRSVRNTGDHFTGGIFCPASHDLAGSLATTQVRILVPDPAGSVVHQGVNYRVSTAGDQLTWTVVERSIDFGSGPVTGRVMEVTVGGTPSAYDQWRSLFFANPDDYANPALSGPQANPSGDGVSNLMRYAHGVGPNDPVLHLLPVIQKSGANHVFKFRYDASKPDLVWRVRATNHPSAWPNTLFDSTTSPIPPLDNGWLSVSIPNHLGAGPAPDPRIFTRLEVTLTPP
jgi:autotransporter-associated beta strand protein